MCIARKFIHPFLSVDVHTKIAEEGKYSSSNDWRMIYIVEEKLHPHSVFAPCIRPVDLSYGIISP